MKQQIQVAAFASALAFSGAAAAGASGYTVSLFQSPGFPLAINDAGQSVSLGSSLAGPVSFAQAGTTPIRLSGVDEAATSEVASLNASRVAVGTCSNDACTWNGSRGATRLAGGRYGLAYAVNDAGVVAGRSYYENNYYATVWRDGVATFLPGGYQCTPTAVNSSGTIVGWAELINPAQSLMWSGDSVVTLANVFEEQSQSIPTAINDAGVVVGFARDVYGHPSPVIWPGVGVALLPVIDGTNAACIAAGISNAGVIVGYCQSDNYPTSQAVAWVDRQLVNLNQYLKKAQRDAGDVLTSARAVSHSGLILVTANASGGRNAAILTPAH